MTILQRIKRNDPTAAADCIDQYGNLVWTMASNLTDSAEDAEKAVREIFLDIWRYAKRFEANDVDEFVFIRMIARRRMIELKKTLNKQSRTNKGRFDK